VHPLRGAIFENLVVMELMKKRYNAGRENNLYFYRESSGKEVDILQTDSWQLHLWEVKSSATYNADFRANMDYLKTLFGDKIKSATVVYDGDTLSPDIINFRKL
jgi:hypothetical protein